LGGVAGGLSERLGIDATVIRIGLVLLALVSGVGVVAYVVAWLVLPLAGGNGAIALRAVADRRGLVLALAFVPALAATLVIGADLDAGFLAPLGWASFVSAAGLVLVWRNAEPDELAWLHQVLDPVVHLGSGPPPALRALAVRIAIGLVLLVGGLALVAFGHTTTAVLRPVGGALLILAAVVVLFGPWWLRLGRNLIDERQARLRAEDRADMASRVHDSVLQTLALIQRSADNPQRVVQLARAQERELRAWLFEGQVPGAIGQGATTLVAGMQVIAGEVEAAHRVTVEVVTVGDCPLDDDLRALLEAAREATVNAAKWSGAPVVSLFSEVEPGRVSVFVRDRGTGFDPVAVADDRRGVAESIRARMQRHGGRATLRTAPGEGTEVELTLARREERA
jgi:signal transduction histidine kinase